MIDPIYKVWLQIEKVERAEGHCEQIETPIELAAFQTRQEALMFCSELQDEHSALVTGEMDLLSEMNSSEQYTAGD